MRLLIGFLAGVVTALSPCVLPVLPILLAGGATGENRRRPFAIIAGLVASFTFFTLAATAILSALDIRKDALTWLAVVVLLVLAATLIFPRFAILLERPFAFLSRRRGGELGGGFLLGASVGLVFVPCAGPVLTTITVLAARNDFGPSTIALMLSFAVGAALPMLAVALGGQRMAQRLRARLTWLRPAMGVVMAVAAIALVPSFQLAQRAQVALGDYTSALQDLIEGTDFARTRLDELTGRNTRFDKKPPPAASRANLPDLGPAPAFTGNSAWLNTPGNRPLTLKQLRGKVVLVDFWTYSCINCIRTIPHLQAWYRAYHRRGLEIVGVHTPEFAFEHELGNVRSAARELGVTWPIALDNDYKTWNAYGNQYWPAHYLVDKRGHVREAHFGEGGYDESERSIRALLAERGAALPKRMADVADETPHERTTPETYLGAARLERYVGSPIRTELTTYRFPTAALPVDSLAYDGRWTVESERAVAGPGARLRIRVSARNVFLVMSGKGRVRRFLDGRPLGAPLRVDGDRLYTVMRSDRMRTGVLELRFTEGVGAYAFTFG